MESNVKGTQPKVGQLQVWWIPQVPMKAFTVEVDSIAEGVKLMGVLAEYDKFQFDNNVKPDYCNAGGINRWEADADGEGNPGWCSWYDDVTGEDDPEAYMEAFERDALLEGQRRGQLTTRIKQKSLELMGREIDAKELRLMPYILDTMMNNQRIDANKINSDEREILSKWRVAGYIEGGAGGLAITPEFWSIICQIVQLGYVDLFDTEGVAS